MVVAEEEEAAVEVVETLNGKCSKIRNNYVCCVIEMKSLTLVASHLRFTHFVPLMFRSSSFERHKQKEREGNRGGGGGRGNDSNRNGGGGTSGKSERPVKQESEAKDRAED